MYIKNIHTWIRNQTRAKTVSEFVSFFPVLVRKMGNAVFYVLPAEESEETARNELTGLCTSVLY